MGKRGHRVRRWIALGVALPLAATTVAVTADIGVAGAASSSSSSSKPYVILYSGDFTGATKYYTAGEVLGLQIAVNEINAKGGLKGRHVQLITQNDQNDPTQAVNLLEQKISSGQVPDAMYPGGSSEVSTALLPITTRAKILTIDATSAATLNDPQKFPYHFGDSSTSIQTVPPYVLEAKAKGYHKIAMIYGDDVAGQASNAAMQAAFTKAGFQFTSVAFPDSAVDVTPQLEQLKAGNPDMLVFSGYGVPTLYILKSRATLGWTVPTYADLLSSAFPIAQNMPQSALTNVYVEQSHPFIQGDPQSQNPKEQKVISEAQAQPNGPAVLGSVGAALVTVGYNVGLLLQTGVKKANSTTTTSVTKALESLKGSIPRSSAPWYNYGLKSQFGDYYYNKTNHFPHVFPNGFTFVAPGILSQQGLYQPGTAPTASS